jgi:hypothetical protein
MKQRINFGKVQQVLMLLWKHWMHLWIGVASQLRPSVRNKTMQLN